MSQEVLGLLFIVGVWAVGLVLFGNFYAKHEGKDRGLCILLALVACLLSTALPLVPGIVAGAATYYVAERKNRNRLVWIILTLALLRLGPVILILLLFLPPVDRPSGAPVLLQLNRNKKGERATDSKR